VSLGPICHDIRTIVRRWPGMASAGGPTARPTPSPFGRCWWTKRRSRTVRRRGRPVSHRTPCEGADKPGRRSR
jgi:hypothetical protein